MDSSSFFKLPLYIKVGHERWFPDRELNLGPRRDRRRSRYELSAIEIQINETSPSARRGFVDLYNKEIISAKYSIISNKFCNLAVLF